MQANLPEIIGGVIVFYEVLARAIPLRKNYSAIHKVLEIALTVSRMFNYEKK